MIKLVALLTITTGTLFWEALRARVNKDHMEALATKMRPKQSILTIRVI